MLNLYYRHIRSKEIKGKYIYYEDHRDESRYFAKAS